VAGIARRAGAPNDRGAGLDLLVQAGDVVREGDPLYIIHANSPADLENAAVLAERTCGLAIAE
jgi:thymidine phosphorylase